MANYSASAEYRGTFRQNSMATLIFRVNELDGTPIDPEIVTYDIVHNLTTTTIAQQQVPEKIKTGIYVFDWSVEDDIDTGKYTIVWQYTIDGVEYEEQQSIVVSTDAADTEYYSGRLFLLRQSLELMIEEAQKVPIYNQIAKPSRDKQRFYFTKDKWNQSRGTTIYLNKEIVTEGYKIDFPRGCVIFDQPLTDADTVQADYNFRWFSDEQLDRFLSNSLHVLNSYAPVTSYFLHVLPDRHISALLYGATVDAIRVLMFNLNYREPEQLYGGPEAAKAKIANFETLKKNYEALWMKLLEEKKKGPYRGLMKSVVVPEYTLPGGRSRWFRMLFSGSAGAG